LQEPVKDAPELFGEIDQLSDPTPPAAVSVKVFPTASVSLVGLTVTGGFTVMMAETELLKASVTVMVSVFPEVVPALYVQVLSPLHDPVKDPPELFGEMVHVFPPPPPVEAKTIVSVTATVFEVGLIVRVGSTMTFVVAVLREESVTWTVSVTPLVLPAT
jgi:hypothetical protein